jgi:hypothetical protein
LGAGGRAVALYTAMPPMKPIVAKPPMSNASFCFLDRGNLFSPNQFCDYGDCDGCSCDDSKAYAP